MRNKMKHIIKNSSSIEHVDWHKPDTLEIKFVSGSTYHYPGCNKIHYDNLKKAASAGQYFQKSIKLMKCKKVSE